MLCPLYVHGVTGVWTCYQIYHDFSLALPYPHHTQLLHYQTFYFHRREQHIRFGNRQFEFADELVAGYG